MKKSIYLVDDSDHLRMLMEYLLADAGFEVSAFADATSFQQGIEQALPDLIVLDIILPDGNGLDMCRELKLNKVTSHIPVFLMSANLDNKLIAKDSFADDFFSKPFDINTFLSKIEEKVAVI